MIMSPRCMWNGARNCWKVAGAPRRGTGLKRGAPEGKYFVKDSLHLSEAGYGLWEEIIKDALSEKL